MCELYVCKACSAHLDSIDRYGDHLAKCPKYLEWCKEHNITPRKPRVYTYKGREFKTQRALRMHVRDKGRKMRTKPCRPRKERRILKGKKSEQKEARENASSENTRQEQAET